jgi:hypothetical protein
MADSTPAALALNTGVDGQLMRDVLMKNKISIGWSVGDSSEDRHRDFRQYSAEEIRDDNPSGDAKMPVVKFLGMHEDDDKNVQIGDDVIAYAPDPERVVVGVFTVSGEAEYDPNPIQLTDERHYYYRNVVPKPWSKPVELDDFREHYTGKQVVRNPTLQPFYGNLSEVADAIKAAPHADIWSDEVSFQREGWEDM